MGPTSIKPEWIEISKIDPENKQFQFRVELTNPQLELSLKEDGQKFPVVLRCYPNGHPERSEGSHPSTDPSVAPQDDKKYQIVCGFTRYTAAKRLQGKGMNNVQIADHIKKSPRAVGRYLEVAGLPERIKNWIRKGELSLGNGYKIAYLCQGGSAQCRPCG